MESVPVRRREDIGRIRDGGTYFSGFLQAGMRSHLPRRNYRDERGKTLHMSFVTCILHVKSCKDDRTLGEPVPLLSHQAGSRHVKLRHPPRYRKGLACLHLESKGNASGLDCPREVHFLEA
jgi:hypothetical protein